MAGLHCGSKPEMVFAFSGVMFAGGAVVFAKPNLTQSKYENLTLPSPACHTGGQLGNVQT